MPDQPTTESRVDLLIIVGHGSGGQHSTNEFDPLLPALKTQLNIPIEVAVLDGSPSTGECIQDSVMTLKPRYGVVLPLFVGSSQTTHQNLQMIVTGSNGRGFETFMHSAKPLGLHEGVLEAYRARVMELYAEDTALLVVGRGSRDAISNTEVHELAQSLADYGQWSMVQVAFYGTADPTIAQAIDQCIQSGSRRIVILPYVLYDRPFAAKVEAQVRSLDKEAEFLFTAPLADDRSILEAISQRVQEAWEELNAKYSSGTHDANTAFQSLLPPRYQGDQAISAAPMGAAGLVYDAQGRVAWDQIWGDFCDLALAGGPPHRGTLLEPIAPESVRANPQQYEWVLDELQRAIQLVTQLSVIRNASLGWIGVQCTDEAMALWLLRAIVVENISVRREGDVLYLPAGPDFRLEHEIKNIVTVMAKTYHYWTEHITAP